MTFLFNMMQEKKTARCYINTYEDLFEDRWVVFGEAVRMSKYLWCRQQTPLRLKPIKMSTKMASLLRLVPQSIMLKIPLSYRLRSST
ncbi:UNVERIFIED_CONTAM: hypothetical protein Sradi_6429700 [Sesamum radiatum]|uniref:Uncharacterized protein n=1 Tax=Sesamum radiatum TaxID=300843 RepID=A0AAW2K3T8_SESRA